MPNNDIKKYKIYDYILGEIDETDNCLKLMNNQLKFNYNLFLKKIINQKKNYNKIKFYCINADTYIHPKNYFLLLYLNINLKLYIIKCQIPQFLP